MVVCDGIMFPMLPLPCESRVAQRMERKRYHDAVQKLGHVPALKCKLALVAFDAHASMRGLLTADPKGSRASTRSR
jgi:hypothetical protein